MANTTNYNWETPDDTDLVKDGAAAIRTLGNSIDTTTKNLNPETTTGDIAYRSATANTNTRLAIGTTGQVLTVAAGVPSWATPTDQTPLTTKGDVFTFSTVDARLGVGANGTVLTADSAETTGLKWAAPAGGGKVLQVVQGDLTANFSTTSTSYVDSGLTVSITPSSASSKVMVFVSFCGKVDRATSGTDNGAQYNLVRTSTQLQRHPIGYNSFASATNAELLIPGNFSYLDSPATTSSTTYKVQVQAFAATTTAYIAASATQIASIVAMEIGA